MYNVKFHSQLWLLIFRVIICEYVIYTILKFKSVKLVGIFLQIYMIMLVFKLNLFNV